MLSCYKNFKHTQDQLSKEELECRQCHKILPKTSQYFKICKATRQYKEKGIVVYRTICRTCSYKNETKSRFRTSEAYLINIVARAKLRAKTKGQPCDIDYPYMLALFKEQNGKCPLTNQILTFGTIHTGKALPTAASIDRIDSSKGYVKGNVWWICYWANLAKSNLSTTDFKTWCGFVVSNETK